MSTLQKFAFGISKWEDVEDGRLQIGGVFSSNTLDKQRDVVPVETMRVAVEKWEAKNLREQHDSKRAVGKAIEFEFDEKAGTSAFTGFVSAAEAGTQTKVREKVLSYFSIAGYARKTETFKAADGKPARRILDFELTEISLVDNPANPDAKISMVKAAGFEEEEPNRFATAVKEGVAKGQAATKPAGADAPVFRVDIAAPQEKPGTPAAPAAPAVEKTAPVVTTPDPAAVQKSKDDLKAAVVALAKNYGGGELCDISQAVQALWCVHDLYDAEAAETDDNSAQLACLNAAITALNRFLELEADELLAGSPDGGPPPAAGNSVDSPDAMDMAAKEAAAKVEKPDRNVLSIATFKAARMQKAAAEVIAGLMEKFEAVQKSTGTPAEPLREVFQEEGAQLAKAIGEGQATTVATSQAAMIEAQREVGKGVVAELKTVIGELAKTVSSTAERVEEIAGQPAMGHAPMRGVLKGVVHAGIGTATAEEKTRLVLGFLRRAHDNAPDMQVKAHLSRWLDIARDELSKGA